MNDKVEVFMT